MDRGSWSVENVLSLFMWRLLYPDHFFLTRGNHESKNLNTMYGFEAEVQAKYDKTVMALLTEVFNVLPLACVINGKVLCRPRSWCRLTSGAGVCHTRRPPDCGQRHVGSDCGD